MTDRMAKRITARLAVVAAARSALEPFNVREVAYRHVEGQKPTEGEGVLFFGATPGAAESVAFNGEGNSSRDSYTMPGTVYTAGHDTTELAETRVAEVFDALESAFTGRGGIGVRNVLVSMDQANGPEPDETSTGTCIAYVPFTLRIINTITP